MIRLERYIKLKLSNGEVKEERLKYGITKRVKLDADVISLELEDKFITTYGEYSLKGLEIFDSLILFYEDSNTKDRYSIEVILGKGEECFLEDYHDVEGKELKGLFYKA